MFYFHILHFATNIKYNRARKKKLALFAIECGNDLRKLWNKYKKKKIAR